MSNVRVRLFRQFQRLTHPLVEIVHHLFGVYSSEDETTRTVEEMVVEEGEVGSGLIIILAFF